MAPKVNRKRLYAGKIGDQKLWWSCFEAGDTVAIVWFTSPDEFDGQASNHNPIPELQYVDVLKELLDDLSPPSFNGATMAYVKNILAGIWGSRYSDEWNKFRSKEAAIVTRINGKHKTQFLNTAKLLAPKDKQSNEEKNGSAKTTTGKEMSSLPWGSDTNLGRLPEALTLRSKQTIQEGNMSTKVMVKKEIDLLPERSVSDSVSLPNPREQTAVATSSPNRLKRSVANIDSPNNEITRKKVRANPVAFDLETSAAAPRRMSATQADIEDQNNTATRKEARTTSSTTNLESPAAHSRPETVTKANIGAQNSMAEGKEAGTDSQAINMESSAAKFRSVTIAEADVESNAIKVRKESRASFSANNLGSPAAAPRSTLMTSAEIEAQSILQSVLRSLVVEVMEDEYTTPQGRAYWKGRLAAFPNLILKDSLVAPTLVMSAAQADTEVQASTSSALRALMVEIMENKYTTPEGSAYWEGRLAAFSG